MHSFDDIISTGNSVEDCICQVITNSSTTTIVALNYFSHNFTCQFFINYESVFYVDYRSISTIVLFKPLPIAPSCNNLSWTLDQIANAVEQYVVGVSAPRNIYIDNYGRLITNEYLGRLIVMNRYNLTVIYRINLGTDALAALSYNDGLYYMGIGVSTSATVPALRVYSTTDLRLIFNLTDNSSYFGPIRECRFLHNNTRMLAISQLTTDYSRILLYEINSPTNYTLITSNIQVPYYGAYSIFKVNDTFFYFTLYVDNKPIYILKLSPDGLNWTISAFVTQGSQPRRISSVAVDYCGRVWAADQFSYIYIYDPISGALLSTFDKVAKPYYILLLDDYELFVGTQEHKIYRFAPHILCTC